MERRVNYPHLGEVVFVKRVRCRSLTVRVGRDLQVKVSLPYYVKYSVAMRFVEEKSEKIALMREKIRRRIEQSQAKRLLCTTEEEVTSLKRRATTILPPLLQQCADFMNLNYPMAGEREPFRYNRLALRNNKSNWGSCSVRKNINLNLKLCLLPTHLCHYVILHELVHLVHHNHGPQFHSLLDNACRQFIGTTEKELRKELRGYTLV